MFGIVIGNFANIFQCKMNHTNPDVWEVALLPGFQCYAGPHLAYCVVSMFLLSLYHGASSMVFPNFQFDEPTLDIKFTANYIIVRQQAEVIVTFITTL